MGNYTPNANSFQTNAEQIKGRFSGYSDSKCETCNKPVTNASKKYSLEVFKKILCRGCQTIEEYSLKANKRGQVEGK